MSVINENKKDCVNFSGIPLYIKDEILKKMNFKTYATFMMTGREAGALSARNDELNYSMPIYRMTLKNDKVSFMDGLRTKVISFEQCAKMKLRPQIVAVQDVCLGIKTCDFLFKLEEIPTFECIFLNGGVPHTAEFFKKAKIDTLKMFIVKFVYGGFDYDTSRIEKVEVYNKRVIKISPYSILKIKAHRSLTVNTEDITVSQINHYLLALLNGSQMPDLIMNNCEMSSEEWVDFMNLLQIEITPKGKAEKILNARGNPFIKMDIQWSENLFNIKFQVL